MQTEKFRSVLKILFKKAVASVNPRKLIHDHLKLVNVDGDAHLLVNGKYYNLLLDVFVVGFGKASLGMTRAVEEVIQPHIRRGIVSTPVGTLSTFPELASRTRALSRIHVYECGQHNLPDKDAEEVARKVRDLVEGLGKNALLLVLISGGGSALLPLPVANVSLQDKLDVTVQLSRAGADIADLSAVRRRLSQLKGGKLAAMASPAQVISLIISDVVGDPMETIASGPTYPSSDPADLAWKTVQKYGLDASIPRNVVTVLTTTPPEDGQKDVTHVDNILIGSNSIAVRAAHEEAQSMSYASIILSNKIEGNVRDVSSAYAMLATNICEFVASNITVEQFNQQFEIIKSTCVISVQTSELVHAMTSSKDLNQPLCLILGGETTVHVTGHGVGGRNQELALHFAVDMHRARETSSVLKDFTVMLLSAGTDGIDGPTDAAGAIGYADLIDQARVQGVDPSSYLTNNDSYNFFNAVNDGHDLIKTGHTGTNVMDIHILVIDRRDCRCKKITSRL